MIIMKRTDVLIIAWLSLSGCTSRLVAQQTLVQRVHRATVACVALPATIADKPNPAKVKLCSDALLCQSTDQSAAEALQKAQAAAATGATDIGAEASAAGLGVLADVACKRGGW